MMDKITNLKKQLDRMDTLIERLQILSRNMRCQSNVAECFSEEIAYNYLIGYYKEVYGDAVEETLDCPYDFFKEINFLKLWFGNELDNELYT